jgi:hypothetical protein
VPSPPLPDQKLTALPSLAMRRAVLRERIVARPESAVREIDALVRAARSGRASGQQGALAVGSALIHLYREGSARALGPLREAAAREGLPLAAALLGGGPSPRALPRLGRLREVCFSERRELRFWAHGRDRDLDHFWRHHLRLLGVGPLLPHPSPVLIGRLLRERWLPLRAVLVIASRRPTSEAIPLVLASHDGWLVRLEVREALVQNPFTPPAVALPLLPSVRATVLRRLRDTGAAIGEAAGVVLGASRAP